MNDAVAAGNVRGRDVGVVNLDPTSAHGESERVAVHGRRNHALGNVRCRDGAFNDVVEENLSQLDLPGRRVVVC